MNLANVLFVTSYRYNSMILRKSGHHIQPWAFIELQALCHIANAITHPPLASGKRGVRGFAVLWRTCSSGIESDPDNR